MKKSPSLCLHPCRQARLALVCAFIIMAAIPLALGRNATPARAAEPTAAEHFTSCISASKQADILLLMDESGSLAGYGNTPGTDPDDTRISAANFFLTRMATIAKDSGSTIKIRIAGFAVDYDPGTSWIALDDANLPKARDALASFADKDHGAGTDYYLGLDGARKELNAQRKKDPKACQAIVFFSDGQLDVVQGPTENDYHSVERPYAKSDPNRTGDWKAATKQAGDALCSATGLATQLRSRSITVFGIGLAPDGQDGKFSLMKDVVTGSHDCGAKAGQTPGMFVTAKNIDDLLFAFNDLTGAQNQERDVCQGKVSNCDAAEVHDIVLDGSISHVDILGTAPVDGVQAWLLSSSGKQIELKHVANQQKLTADGMAGTYSWLSGHTLSTRWDKAGDAAAWAGTWRLVFVDPASASTGKKSRVGVEVKGDLSAVVVEPKDLVSLRQDSPLDVTLGLIDGDGKPVLPSELRGTMRLNADLVDVAGGSTPLAQGLDAAVIAQPVPLDASDSTPGPASLILTLQYTTAGTSGAAGTTLLPSSTELPISVLPPANYPLVADALDFGALEGPADATADISVQGPGCAWLDPTALVIDGAPDGIGDVSFDSSAIGQDSCFEVAEGTTSALPVHLRTHDGGNGDLLGTITIKTVPLDAPDKAPVDVIVHYSAEMSRPLNQVNFTIVLIASLLLGVGIPVGLAYLAKYLFNSTIPRQSLYAIERTVTAGPGQLLQDGRPLQIDYASLKDMLPGTGKRHLTAGSFHLASVMGLSPFGSATAHFEGVPCGATSCEPIASTKPTLPLVMANTWSLVKRPGMAPDEAGLLVLLSSTMRDGQTKVDELIDQLNIKGPVLIEQLTTLMTDAPNNSQSSVASNFYDSETGETRQGLPNYYDEPTPDPTNFYDD